MPWTREQIEAWVNAPSDRAARISRAAIVRLFPEAPDYDVLRERINEMEEFWVTRRWRATATDEEIVAHIERACAALWSRSLSEASDADAR